MKTSCWKRIPLFGLVLSLLVASPFDRALQAQANPAPVEKSGRIKQILITPQGETDGFVLEDNTAVRFEPTVSNPKGALTEGREIRVRGVPRGGQIYARTLDFPQLKESIHLEQSAGTLTPRPTKYLKPMKDSADVETILRSADGKIETLVLSNHAVIRLNALSRLGLPKDLKTGQEVSLVGRGEEYPQGKAILADWIQPVG